MLPIQPLLEKKIKRSGLQSFIGARAVLMQFQEIAREILPAEIFKEITPISFQNGILKIHTSHPIISMEFRIYENIIIKRLQLKKIMIEQ